MTYVYSLADTPRDTAAEYLLRTPLGLHAAPLIETSLLLAPALIDVEVLSVLRRAVRRKVLTEARALEALGDLTAWPIERLSHQRFLPEAWSHRHHVSAYDAFYVAASKLYAAPLLTADGPLAHAPRLGIGVQNIRLS